MAGTLIGSIYNMASGIASVCEISYHTGKCVLLYTYQ